VENQYVKLFAKIVRINSFPSFRKDIIIIENYARVGVGAQRPGGEAPLLPEAVNE
jgi:hypothetical protein